MILDERLEFADATALSTSGTGRALVGDVIDLTTGDFGHEPLYLVIQVTTAVTSGGSATVSFELASDAAAAIATDASATQHWASAAIAKATLIAGYTQIVPIPPSTSSNPYERYVGILQNVATAALTAGAINAVITHDPHNWITYPDAL